MSKRNHNKWNKKKIIEAVGKHVSHVCIVKHDGEWIILGKYCVLTPLPDGSWDIWLCNPADKPAGLHPKRLNHKVQVLKKCPGIARLRILDGEAYANIQCIEELVSNRELLRHLGIRRKKLLSDKDREDLLRRLSKNNRKKAAA